MGGVFSYPICVPQILSGVPEEEASEKEKRSVAHDEDAVK